MTKSMAKMHESEWWHKTEIDLSKLECCSSVPRYVNSNYKHIFKYDTTQAHSITIIPAFFVYNRVHDFHRLAVPSAANISNSIQIMKIQQLSATEMCT